MAIVRVRFWRRKKAATAHIRRTGHTCSFQGEPITTGQGLDGQSGSDTSRLARVASSIATAAITEPAGAISARGSDLDYLSVQETNHHQPLRFMGLQGHCQGWNCARYRLNGANILRPTLRPNDLTPP